MRVYKQIQEKFWQNDFVLNLAPEERYFYIYLITNTMTTACGIYRFNLKLAVLETGLSSDVINNYLKAFESSGKIIISKTSGEIMIINWLKHNFKMNKRTIADINAELKEVKDKELLSRFYEICSLRQYPVEELFKGVPLSAAIKVEHGNVVQAMREDSDDIVQTIQEQSQDTKQTMHEDPCRLEKAAPKASGQKENTDIHEPSQGEVKDVKEASSVLFEGFEAVSKGRRRRKGREKPAEEVEVEICSEEDPEQPVEGTVIKGWSFNDSGEIRCGDS